MCSSPRADWEVVRGSSIVRQYALTEQVIYRGLASTIFLGIELKTRLQVGIKAILKHRIDSEEERRAAAAEVQIHSTIPQHCNVIRLLAAEETPHAILLVTPYTPYGDLWELMRYGQTYCELQVRNCAAQILSALHHIHAVCDLIHGDIKPHNFLLFKVDGKYAVQLCDFGLAEHPDTPGGTLTFRGLRGTSGWFPPELLEYRDYSHTADLFSCGLIFFRMLGGYPPFDPPSNFRIPLEFDDRYWCHVSPSCKLLLAQLLALEPAERGTALSCAEHDWFSGPPPVEPSPEQLKQMSAYGPPPITDVIFWPPGEIPSSEQRNSYADLQSLMVDDDSDMDVS